jgi:hypothetical protein
VTTADLAHIEALFTRVLAAPALEADSLLVRDRRIAAMAGASH